jgi:hypothetical protein
VTGGTLPGGSCRLREACGLHPARSFADGPLAIAAPNARTWHNAPATRAALHNPWPWSSIRYTYRTLVGEAGRCGVRAASSATSPRQGAYEQSLPDAVSACSDPSPTDGLLHSRLNSHPFAPVQNAPCWVLVAGLGLTRFGVCGSFSRSRARRAGRSQVLPARLPRGGVDSAAVLGTCHRSAILP